MSRKKVFEKDAPAGWVPTVGEAVWLRHLRGQISVLAARGVCTAIAQDIATVRIQYGSRTFHHNFKVSDLRPRKVKP